MFLCAALLAWQLFLPGFIGMADNGDFGKALGPVCLGSADSAAANRLFFQPDYLRGSQFCYDPHVPMSEKAFVWLASSVQQRLSDPGRFDIRWLGALHTLTFLGFYYVLLRLLRPLYLIPRLLLSLFALWIFADVGLTAYFNSFYSDTAAILGALVAAVAAVALIEGKTPRLALLTAFALAALLLTVSKAQHGVFGPLAVALAVLLGRRSQDTRTRVLAYSSAVILLLGTTYILTATPEWYKAQARFNLIFGKLTQEPASRVKHLRELGLDAEDARYVGMNAYMSDSPMQNASWRERFYARTSYGNTVRFYVRHPGEALAILRSDLHDEAWQRRSFSLSNYRQECGLPAGALTGRFSSWSFLRTELFRLWPAHILAWYALLAPASLLFALRETSPFRRSLAWIVLAVSIVAAGEFGIASLADACETSRHLLMFHIFTDCTFFFALLFAASRFNAATRIESRPVLFTALAGLVVLGTLMARLDAFQPRPVPSHPASPGWIDNANPQITYSGRWEAGTFRGALGGTVSYSDATGATARYPFDGTAVQYVHTKAFNRGFALVTIDGIERGVVDLYTPSIEWQASTVFGGLKPGRHTAEIRVLGRRNPASSANFVDIDALAGR